MLDALRRVITTIVLFVVMAAGMFLAIEALPGDGCTSLLGRASTPAKLATCRAENGLDKPVLTRMGSWFGDVATGDLGYSIKRDKPVAEIMGPRVRNSLVLGGISALLAFPAAILVGLIAGRSPTSRFSRFSDRIALIFMTLPEFVTGAVLWLVLAIWLPIFPGVTILPTDATLAQILPTVWLPALTIASMLFAHVMRTTRASVNMVNSRPFVDAARWRGIPEKVVMRRHVLPAAAAPVISVTGVTVAWLFTSTFVVEAVFNFPGLGRLAVDAISDRDTMLILPLVLFGLFVYMGSSLVADLLIRAVDPRVRAGLGGQG